MNQLFIDTTFLSLEEIDEVMKSENPRDAKMKLAWEIVKIVVIASVIVLPIRYFLFQPFIVKGESMMPNYQDGNYLIIDEISYRFIEPKRGDVIVFKTEFIAGYKNDRFIKRIMALPGETIEIKNNKVKSMLNKS